MDAELIDEFVKEVASKQEALKACVEALKENLSQPQQFLQFSQIIDGIYGTAATLGFKELADYTGLLRNICRKCGQLNIPRSMPPVLKMMQRCMENFEVIVTSIQKPGALNQIRSSILLDTSRAKKVEEEIFSFSKGKSESDK